MRKLLFILFLINMSIIADAQELNCQVSINSQQVDGADKRRFQTLQTSVFEFMNNRVWTNRKFKTEERIDCSVFITFNTSTSGEAYQGSIQIQSRRPIFNSSYNSPLLNIKDDNFSFSWVEYDPLNFDINSFTSNLTSVLAYYAYLIIGMDFDSYSALGGTEYLNHAQTVVNNAQSASYTGWKSFESDKNRYWFMENILNSRYEDFRGFTYKFHREGLDVMYNNASKGRTEALKAIKLLSKVHKVRPNLRIMKVLFDAKRDEFIGLFAGGQAGEKSQAKDLLISIDPSNAGKYQKMVTGGK